MINFWFNNFTINVFALKKHQDAFCVSRDNKRWLSVHANFHVVVLDPFKMFLTNVLVFHQLTHDFFSALKMGRFIRIVCNFIIVKEIKQIAYKNIKECNGPIIEPCGIEHWRTPNSMSWMNHWFFTFACNSINV